MFSRFFNTTKALFKKSRSDQEPLDSPASSEQLHSELSDAVEVGMVTTRRQSHGLPNEELRDGSEIDTPRTVSRKRKNGNSESSTPMGGPAKRRKSGLEIADDNGSDGSGTSALMASRQQGLATKVDSQKLGGNEAAGQKEDALALVGQRSVPELGTAETWTEPDDNTPGIKHRQRSTSQRAGAVLLGTARDDQHSAADVKIAALTRAMPPHDILKQYNETASVLNANSEVNKTSGNGMSTMSKATHFRFGSEEPDVKAQAMSKGQTHLEAQSASILERSEESDNEDEAPEIVTASAGVKTARARTLEAAKAAERQRVASKEKRRERDFLLKQQARSSEKNKRRNAEEMSDDSSEPDRLVDSTNVIPRVPHNHATPESIVTKRLPALLPDEILTAEPAARPPTPPLNLEHRKKSKPKKHTFVDAEAKPPKDIKRGPVNVRVLEVGRQSLPPKGSKESRNMKESWLAGRRGRNGAGVFERRKIGEGFVRK